MSDPRDHHFIPRFFLEKWTGSNKKLVEYTIKRGRLISKEVGPKGTGYERDLYAFPELPADSSQFIEKVFWDYADRVAHKAFSLHHGSNVLQWNDEIISAWSRFLIGIHLRHPDAMPELRRAAKEIWDKGDAVTEAEYAKLRRGGDPATFAEYLREIDPLVELKMRVNQIVTAFDNPEVGNVINNMKWQVLDVSQGQLPLLLSDRPIEFFRLKEANGVISIPISPDKVFVAANSRDVLDQIARAKPRRLATSLNRYVVSRARRYVWSRDHSLKTFIAAKMSTAMEQTPLFPSLASGVETPPSLQVTT